MQQKVEQLPTEESGMGRWLQKKEERALGAQEGGMEAAEVAKTTHWRGREEIADRPMAATEKRKMMGKRRETLRLLMRKKTWPSGRRGGRAGF